jgi:hypothetical protein
MTTLEGSGSALELHPRQPGKTSRQAAPPSRGSASDTSYMPGFVDPRPHQEAELRTKRAEVAAATDEAERTRLQGELTELEHSMGRGRGFVRRFFLGWGHRSVPW